jgi:hypothetical protein
VDVEKTIEFILEQQTKTDTQLEAIRKLIRVGMRMIVRIGQAQERTDQQIAKLTDSQARTDVKMAELADAQKVTEQKFQALLDTLPENRNGHDRCSSRRPERSQYLLPRRRRRRKKTTQTAQE